MFPVLKVYDSNPTRSFDSLLTLCLPSREWVSNGVSGNVRGGRGAEAAVYFRRNSCARQIFGNICRLNVFFMRKSV